MRKQYAIHNNPRVRVENGKFVTYIEHREVRVLAIAENWAMVRVKRGATYAAPMKEIRLVTEANDGGERAE